jgi:hypothetical protein
MFSAAHTAIIPILYFGIVVPAYAIFIRVAARTLPWQHNSKAQENIPWVSRAPVKASLGQLVLVSFKFLQRFYY